MHLASYFFGRAPLASGQAVAPGGRRRCSGIRPSAGGVLGLGQAFVHAARCPGCARSLPGSRLPPPVAACRSAGLPWCITIRSSRGRFAARLNSGVRAVVEILVSLTYCFSLAVFTAALFFLPVHRKPLPFRWITPTSRDMIVIGTILIALACYSTFVLATGLETGSIRPIFIRHSRSPTLAAIDDPVAFAQSVYARAVFTPFVLAFGLRAIAYGRQLRQQP